MYVFLVKKSAKTFGIFLSTNHSRMTKDEIGDGIKVLAILKILPREGNNHASVARCSRVSAGLTVLHT